MKKPLAMSTHDLSRWAHDHDYGNLGNAAPNGAGAHDADRVKAGRVHGDTLWRQRAPRRSPQKLSKQ